MIPAGQTVGIDTRPFGNYIGQVYVLNLYNSDEGVYLQMQVGVSRSGNSIKYNVSSKLGDDVTVVHKVSIQGSDVVVSVQNSEAFDISAVFTKLDIR